MVRRGGSDEDFAADSLLGSLDESAGTDGRAGICLHDLRLSPIGADAVTDRGRSFFFVVQAVHNNAGAQTSGITGDSCTDSAQNRRRWDSGC